VSLNGRKTKKQNGSEEDLRYLPQQGTPVEAITTNKQKETLGEGGAAGRKNFATKTKRKKKEKRNRIER
jgi:hypothetical protein